ncbi:MAG: hypothetical protein CL920_36770 [Deltaproteobacteria bacterium]|nr:hypothetical protein [Deltaproteobacteria bacterium]
MIAICMGFWGKGNKDPSGDLRPPAPPVTSALCFGRQGEQYKPPSGGLRPPAPPVRPALCFGRQGERCISNDIPRYKPNERIYRLNGPSSRKA